MTLPPLTDLTDRELTKALLSEQDTEALIRYWMQDLVDWLNQHPVSSYAIPNKETQDEQE